MDRPALIGEDRFVVPRIGLALGCALLAGCSCESDPPSTPDAGAPDASSDAGPVSMRNACDPIDPATLPPDPTEMGTAPRTAVTIETVAPALLSLRTEAGDPIDYALPGFDLTEYFTAGEMGEYAAGMDPATGGTQWAVRTATHIASVVSVEAMDVFTDDSPLVTLGAVDCNATDITTCSAGVRVHVLIARDNMETTGIVAGELSRFVGWQILAVGLSSADVLGADCPTRMTELRVAFAGPLDPMP